MGDMGAGLGMLVVETIATFGRRGDLLKVLWWDGQGLCLFAKRLERGRFLIVRRAPVQSRGGRRQPVRRPLPEHLPREEIAHDPGSTCPGCGGTRFSRIGEDVTEVLEKVPARLKVIRHIRPKLSCRACERIIQAPAPGGYGPMWWTSGPGRAGARRRPITASARTAAASGRAIIWPSSAG